MKLTNLQRVILAVYAIVIVNICIFYAPKSFIGPYSADNNVTIVQFLGRSPIWEQTKYFQETSLPGIMNWNEFIRIDYYRMFAEAFTATIVTLVLLAITAPSKTRKKDDDEHGQQT